MKVEEDGAVVVAVEGGVVYEEEVVLGSVGAEGGV